MNKKILGTLMIAALTGAGSASAAITTATTIDFEGLSTAAIAGTPNKSGTAGNTGTYVEDGMRFGIVADPLDAISHLHRLPGTATGTALQYHSDSSGIYFRASDDSAFSVWSMLFDAHYDAGENPHIGANDTWEIYGFAAARNPGLLTTNVDGNNMPTDPNQGIGGTVVAHASVANGFSGTLNLLSLDANFKNVKSVWIHFNGFPHSPAAYLEYDEDGNPIGSAYQFGMHVDNIVLNAANVIPAPVPVPAAAWLFGSALLGLSGAARKRRVAA